MINLFSLHSNNFEVNIQFYNDDGTINPNASIYDIGTFPVKNPLIKWSVSRQKETNENGKSIVSVCIDDNLYELCDNIKESNKFF